MPPQRVQGSWIFQTNWGESYSCVASFSMYPFFPSHWWTLQTPPPTLSGSPTPSPQPLSITSPLFIATRRNKWRESKEDLLPPTAKVLETPPLNHEGQWLYIFPLLRRCLEKRKTFTLFSLAWCCPLYCVCESSVGKKRKSTLSLLQRERPRFFLSRWLPFWNMRSCLCWTVSAAAHATMSLTNALFPLKPSGRKEKIYIKQQHLFAQATWEANFHSPHWLGEARLEPCFCQRNQSTSSLAANFCKTWSGSGKKKHKKTAGSMLFGLIALPFPAMTHICQERGYLQGKKRV